MADKINQIEIGGITYDLQDKKSIFSGTAAEYEAVADVIEDGTVVNITDDFVEGETLDTYVLNKVDELEDKLGSGIKTREELMTNAEEGRLADALAIKEAIEHHDMFMDNIMCGSLDEFLQKTAVKINLANHSIPAIGRVKDTTGWGPNKGSSLWYRFIVLYQNGYSTSIKDDINGNGIFWTDNDMWNVTILGIQSTGFTLKYERVNKPTITTRQDLMANTVSGLFPDALAVKDTFNYYNIARNTNKTYATIEEFVEATATNINVPHMGRFKDTTGFMHNNGTARWFRYFITYQNMYKEGDTANVAGNGLFFDEEGRIWNVFIRGNKDTGLQHSIKEVCMKSEVTDRRKYKTYSTLADLDLTLDDIVDMTSIGTKLASASYLEMSVNIVYLDTFYEAGLIPVKITGILKIVNANNRGRAEFYPEGTSEYGAGNLYIRNVSTCETTDISLWSSWYRIVGEKVN